MTSFRRLELVFAFLLSIALAWSVFVVDFLPSNDGPQHAFAGYVKGHHDDPDSGWSDMYRLNDPLTSNGYMDLLVPLEAMVGLEAAHQIVVVFLILCWALAWFVWLRGEVGPGTFAALLAFPCALQWGIWIGLYPFILSSAFIPVVLLVRRRYGLTVPAGISLSLTLLFAARIHVFGAALAGAVLLGTSLWDLRPLRSTMKIVLIGLPSFLYAVLITTRSTMISIKGATWDSPYDVIDLFTEYFLPGPTLMRAAFLLVIVLAVASAVRSERRRHISLAMGLLLLCIGLILPLDWSGWELIRPRLLPTAFMMIIGSAVVPRRFITIVAIGAVSFSIWRVSWAADLHRKAADELKAVIEITEGVDLRGQRWTYVVTDGPPSHVYDDVRLAGSTLHLAQMVAPHIGGAPYFSHDGDATMHHILVRDERPKTWMGSLHKPEYVRGAWDPITHRRVRDLHISTYLASLSFLDVVLLYGLPGDAELLKEAGYRVEELKRDQSGHVLVAGRFVGCTWNIHIDGLQEPTVVTMGFALAEDMQDAWIVDVAGELRVDGAPCGPAWFSVEAGCREEHGAAGHVPVRPTTDAQDLGCHVLPQAPSQDVPVSESR
jgi:hypothetical protein